MALRGIMPRVFIDHVNRPLDALLTCSGRKRAGDILPTAEAFSHKDATFVAPDFFEAQGAETINPLMMAATTAFATHRPLELSPDVVYNVILQGIAAHVATDPEKFRNLLVSHQKGKEELAVRDDRLVAGSWDNDWGSSLNRLRDMIMERIPAGSAASEGFGLAFTTTTRDNYVAHSAVLMEVMKDYYEYTVMTLCGIPWVDLQGTEEDWAVLAGRINKALPVLGLSGWNANLQEILREISSVYQGKTNTGFWQKMYKHHGARGSGGVARVDGWLAKLFLYTSAGINRLAVGQADEELSHLDEPVLPQAVIPQAVTRPSLPRSTSDTPWADEAFWQSLRQGDQSPAEGTAALWSSASGSIHGAAPPQTSSSPRGHGLERGVPLADFFVGLSETPFIWDYYGTKLEMVLRAGLVGVSVTTSGALCPQVGWVIGKRK
jgi:hypothetical protein